MTSALCFVSFSFRWLITPYRDNGHMAPQQGRFNTVLSSLRQKVERAIGLLKGRWRKLLFLDHWDLTLSVHLVISACVLHNICLVNDDYYECCMDDDGNDDHPVDEHHCSDERAEQKRTHLMNIVCPWSSLSIQSIYLCYIIIMATNKAI